MHCLQKRVQQDFATKIQEKQNKPGHNTQGYVHALVMTRVLKTQRLEIWKNRPKLSQHSTASTASWALVSAAASKAGAAAARRSPKSAGGAKPYARHCPFTGDDRHRHPRQIVVASPPSPSHDCRSSASALATVRPASMLASAVHCSSTADTLLRQQWWRGGARCTARRGWCANELSMHGVARL